MDKGPKISADDLLKFDEADRLKGTPTLTQKKYQKNKRRVAQDRYSDKTVTRGP